MTNPVLVEITRGTRVESQHRGSYAVVDPDGKIVASAGDIDAPVFPRSAVKAFQALPLLETGAADKYQLTDAEIALCVASHSGEPEHAETAAGILKKAGLDKSALECGAHWPMGDAATRALAAKHEEPSALHNNCSGKHSGFLCVACAMDYDPKGYVGRTHPVQREIKIVCEAMTGATLGDDVCGTDGCSIPTYAAPLRGIAKGFAQLGSGHGLAPKRAEAARRIFKAVAAHPFMVAGTGRFDTEAMNILRERVFMKTGAEGVYCASFPELGYGIALKIDDGATRASQAVMEALIQKYLPLDDATKTKLSTLGEPTMKNWNKIEVGKVRAVI